MQIAALFTCALISYINGNAMLVLLPVHTTRLGADPAVTGVALAMAFAALAVGTISGGWLAARLGRHKSLILLAAVINMPCMLLMGYTEHIAVMTAFMALSWFVSGVMLTMVNILIGMQASASQRGRSFGIIGVAMAGGQLVGGAVAGPLVDHGGFGLLFAFAAALNVVILLAGLVIEEKAPAQTKRPITQTPDAVPASNAFLLLFAASVLVTTASFTISLGRPLVMTSLNFDSTAIASTITISGLVNLPLPLVIGWLSDRLGRKPLLLLCYVIGMGGLGVFALATQVWQFWLAQILVTVMGSATAVGSALVIDLVPARLRSTSLSWFLVTPWIGGVIGFAVTGVAIQALGMPVTFGLSILLPLIAIILTGLMRSGRAALVAQPG